MSQQENNPIIDKICHLSIQRSINKKRISSKHLMRKFSIGNAYVCKAVSKSVCRYVCSMQSFAGNSVAAFL